MENRLGKIERAMALTGLISICAIPPAWARSFCDADVCIHTEESDTSVTFRAENRNFASPVGVKVWFELSNMVEDLQEGPVTLQAGERRTIARIKQRRNGRFGWQFWYRWNHGTVGPRHDDGVRYRLPWEAGRTVEAGQGCNKPFSHNAKRGFASDFWMPTGTAVHAARDGKIVRTEARFEKGGNDPALGEMANLVAILHGDGTSAVYMHLRQGGVAVREGQRVQAGDLIGYSGNTGFSTAPHLHFEVYGLDRDLDWNSIKVTYDTANGPVTCPDYGRMLTAR